MFSEMGRGVDSGGEGLRVGMGLDGMGEISFVLLF